MSTNNNSSAPEHHNGSPVVEDLIGGLIQQFEARRRYEAERFRQFALVASINPRTRHIVKALRQGLRRKP
jgi:hypothetical protein